MKTPLEKIKLTALAAFSSIFVLSACGNKGGGGNGGGGGTIAQTPCNGPATAGGCDPGVYSQTPGLMIPNAVPYNTGGINGYCGCDLSYRPIYNPQWGFACAPNSYFQHPAYMGYSYGNIFQPQNYGNVNIQQITYSAASYGGSSCYTNFASSCDVRIPNSCGSDGYCRAIGGASTIGLCTVGNGTDYYNGGYYSSGNGFSTYPYYSSSFGGGAYLGGSFGGAWGSGNCRYRQNSWGLTYWYCGP